MPFAQVANAVLYDPRLSLKAKGLYALMYAKPDGWNFAAERIAKHEARDGIEAIRSAMSELLLAGYMVRSRQKDGRMDYLLRTSAEAVDKMGTDGGEGEEKPQAGNPTEAKSLGGFLQAVSNTEDVTNTEQ